VTSTLLTPPIALLAYLILVGVLAGSGRMLAGGGRPTPLKSTTYASGEEAPSAQAVPGYRPFFVIGLFFAILHLGALMVATSELTPLAAAYLAGLILALVALILG
jgi:NADH:ubiquinone oxidoreductase subunit 3 (subunit A)